MPMIAPVSGGGDFEKAPEGVHIGRIYRIVFCGTHLNATYGNRQAKVQVSWELPNTLMQEGENAGKPFMVTKTYTFSWDERSNLRADMEGMYGKKFDSSRLEKAGGFDLEKVLGRACQVNVAYSEDKKYVNVIGLMPLPNGSDAPNGVNQQVIIGQGDWGSAEYMKLSDKMRQWIESSDEWEGEKRARSSVPPDEPPFDDSVPFGDDPF